MVYREFKKLELEDELSWLKKYVESLRVPSVLPLVVRNSFRFNGRFQNDRFVTLERHELCTVHMCLNF